MAEPGTMDGHRPFKRVDLQCILARYITEYSIVVAEETFDPFYFESAFTHKSVHRETSYERLEFVGDAIYSAVVSTYIYERYPGESEAFLTRLRVKLVTGTFMAQLSHAMALDTYVRLAPSHEAMRSRPSLKEDVFEAFVGAIYMAMGYDTVYSFVVGVLEEHADLSELARDILGPREAVIRMAEQITGGKPEFKTPADGGMDIVDLHGAVIASGSDAARAYKSALDQMIQAL